MKWKYLRIHFHSSAPSQLNAICWNNNRSHACHIPLISIEGCGCNSNTPCLSFWLSTFFFVIGAYYILWKASSENKLDSTPRTTWWDGHQPLVWIYHDHEWKSWVNIADFIWDSVSFSVGRQLGRVGMKLHFLDSMSSTPPSEGFKW